MSPTVVLVHGLAINRRASEMFTGVQETLEAAGHRVARTETQGDGSLEELADRVWAQIEPLPGPLVLLCHSMGGLQARTFLLDERRAERIQAIATVGSPHLGTPLARLVGPFGRAYRALTPKSRALWQTRHAEEEERAAARHGVRRLSVVAATERPRHRDLLVPAALLSRLEGINDGLVAAPSQRYGEHAFEVDLDHLESVALRTPHPAALALWSRLLDLCLHETQSHAAR